MITFHVYPNRVTVVRVSGTVRAPSWQDTFAMIRRDPNFHPCMNWVVIATDDKVITDKMAAELGAILSAIHGVESDLQKCAFVVPGASRQNRLELKFSAATRHNIVARVFTSEPAAMAWAGWTPARTPKAIPVRR